MVKKPDTLAVNFCEEQFRLLTPVSLRSFFFSNLTSKYKCSLKVECVHLFGGTFVVITICSIGNFIASVLCFICD